eukprot:2021896-Prymnesium_polylepis.1
MRVVPLAAVAICTFALTRLLDVLTSPPPAQLGTHASVRVLEEPVPPVALGHDSGARYSGAVPTAETAAPTTAAPKSAASVEAAAATGSPRAPEYLIVIGMPIGVNDRNRDRRNLLRRLWISEYPNIGKTVRAEFIVGLQTYQGDGHDAETIRGLYDEHAKYGDLAMVNAREATTDPYRGDPKNTGEKLVAWMRLVVMMYAKAAYFVKADWDSWIHTTRLEHNVQRLLAGPQPPMYFGNTLWCSYSVRNFQPCGYGFGPLQAAGSRK